jgi:citrate synthase
MSVAEDFPPAKTDEASLKLGDAQHDLPVRKGTLGPDVIDIASLYQDTGCFTYDPGFTSTASCESKITYIDGDQGILLYRGSNCRRKNSTRCSSSGSLGTPWCTSR